jgi:CYTH domain-containing protein
VYRTDKYARVEYERRFWLARTPEELDQAGYDRIVDHYLEGTRLRLRRIESREGRVVALKLTQKYLDGDTDQATITNFYLDEREYALLARLGGRELIKRRYRYHRQASHYSIDVFEGPLAGLILAEAEAPTEAALAAVKPPPNTIREVTADRSFTGGYLVGLSRQVFLDWRASWPGLGMGE